MTGTPSDFYDKITKTFDSAVESGDLIYSKGTTESATIDGLTYYFSIVPALESKPTVSGNETLLAKISLEDSEPDVPTKPFDPFDPPHPALLVLDEYESDYAVVLNKFSVIPNHFLLVTRDFKSQNSPLSPPDLVASYKLLKAANSQSGKRHVGFFNCGKNSGASVSHRHVQFLTLPEGFTPFPDDLVAGAAGKKYEDGQSPFAHNQVSFSHYVVPIHDTDEDALGFRFSTLLSRTLTTLRQHKASPISFNFLFTEEWFLMVPRIAESSEGTSINALATIGLLLAKGDEDLKSIKEKGPQKLLESVCIPWDGAEELEYDY